MNMPLWIMRTIYSIARFTQLQLFITLFSLPILICWGLPLSILSPIGNLIFGPALTLFLFFSSLIFFTELLYLPNGWIITALEITTTWWMRIMPADTHTWLIGFAKPSLGILLFFNLAAIAIMLNKKTNSLWRSIGCFSALMIGLCLYIHCIAAPATLATTVPCSRGQITILTVDGATVVIDPGYLGQKISAASWAQYTLIPQLIQVTGKNSIDHLIVLQPNGMLFEALERLCIKMHVDNIYMPYWQGTMKRTAVQRYNALKQATHEQTTTMHRLGNQPLTITLQETSITIEPLPKIIKNQEISYPAYAIRTCIDNQDITLYSARYIKKKPACVRQSQTI